MRCFKRLKGHSKLRKEVRHEVGCASAAVCHANEFAPLRDV